MKASVRSGSRPRAPRLNETAQCSGAAPAQPFRPSGSRIITSKANSCSQRVSRVGPNASRDAAHLRDASPQFAPSRVTRGSITATAARVPHPTTGPSGTRMGREEARRASMPVPSRTTAVRAMKNNQPASHRLTPLAMPQHVCDICLRRGTAFRCERGCDYDVCLSCFKAGHVRHIAAPVTNPVLSEEALERVTTAPQVQVEEPSEVSEIQISLVELEPPETHPGSAGTVAGREVPDVLEVAQLLAETVPQPVAIPRCSCCAAPLREVQYRCYICPSEFTLCEQCYQAHNQRPLHNPEHRFVGMEAPQEIAVAPGDHDEQLFLARRRLAQSDVAAQGPHIPGPGGHLTFGGSLVESFDAHTPEHRHAASGHAANPGRGIPMGALQGLSGLTTHPHTHAHHTTSGDGESSGAAATADAAGAVRGDLQQCMVCLEDYAPGDAQRALRCGHHFHRACVDTWLAQNETCPICRTSAVYVSPLSRFLDNISSALLPFPERRRR
eukprot:RCo011514